MSGSIFAAVNGRKIPKEDKVFGISTMAQEMIREKGKDAVVNATIGTLMDDDGKLIVLSSVDKTFRSLKPQEYAAYASIGGLPAFKKAAIQAALGNYAPGGPQGDVLAGRHIRAVATMGGTGGIRHTVANYSQPGDAILVGDWRWGPYGQIAGELGRTLETFPLFTEDGKFNVKALAATVRDILSRQERLVLILNTPAHNPTGYSMTDDDFRALKAIFEEVELSKKIALLIDSAYIDFAGDEHEVRSFLPILTEMPVNVLPIVGYSMSKTFTIYGMRCGAMICLAQSEEIADEFSQFCEFSCRATWSNPNRSAQELIAKIFADPELLAAVSAERKELRDMLLRRGRAFEAAAKECGLAMVPFSAGFFCSIPSKDPEALAAKLREEGVFLIPLAMGVRVSIASISETACRALPARIKAAMTALGE
ncbi:MAG: aminotransferase class I/II-fold pyridoxal phosphate-dependent enzyme [Firmicutes bacterium]|nr:aminotransferase class I/II-fold pyridoxal phosphate-dependent enzyme [Bacillota bacterium]